MPARHHACRQASSARVIYTASRRGAQCRAPRVHGSLRARRVDASSLIAQRRPYVEQAGRARRRRMHTRPSLVRRGWRPSAGSRSSNAIETLLLISSGRRRGWSVRSCRNAWSRQRGCIRWRTPRGSHALHASPGPAVAPCCRQPSVAPVLSPDCMARLQACDGFMSRWPTRCQYGAGRRGLR